MLTAAGLIEPYPDETVDASSQLSSIRFHLAAMGTHGRGTAPTSTTPAAQPGQWEPDGSA
ncbi:hypothetical protein [Streptomyces sp. NPDC048473]|uniref:hypothetical protein n=1 Tax=unclassified Streptomyces TaxID=2593676 RepID=UPI00372133B8